MRFTLPAAVLLSIFFIIFIFHSCSKEPTEPEPTKQKDVSVHGKVTGIIDYPGYTETIDLVGAKVEVYADLDQDKSKDSGETFETITDSKGEYALSVKVVEKKPEILLSVDMENYSQFSKKITVTGNEMDFPVSLTALQPMFSLGGEWVTADNKVVLKNVPTEVDKASARLFNPATEEESFPGEFEDADGNQLISSVFAYFDLRDKEGESITNLGADVGMKLQIPVETWGTLRDFKPATEDTVEVPLYSFDENTGEWAYEKTGYLVDEKDELILPAQLAEINGGTYSGEIYAAGSVNHMSYWNVDWPVETHACVYGKVKSEEGKYVSGAEVTAFGVTYSGTSTPQFTGGDGYFCVEVLRSENAGEDVNNNGKKGETQKIQIKVRYEGFLYIFGPVDTPKDNGTCGGQLCRDLGDLVLSDENKAVWEMCTIRGRAFVTDSLPGFGGAPRAKTPAAEALITAGVEDLGNVPPDSCVFFDTADDSGYFELKIPVLTEFEIFGLYYRNQQTEDPFDDVYAVNTLKFAASECEDGEMELELDLYILYKAFKIGVWSYNSDTKTFNFDTDSCGFSLDNVDADQYGQPDTIFTALLQAQGACKTGTFTLMSFDYLLPDGGAFAVWNWTNILTMNYNNGGIYAPERGEGDPLWSGDVYQVVVMKSLGNTGWNNLSFKDDSGEILAHIMK